MITKVKRGRASRMSPVERTAAIMDAARQVFVEKGFSDTTIAEIAGRAGVVEGNIYRYFSNKRELMFRVAETWLDELISDGAAHLASISGARNRLRFVIHRHFLTIKSDPDLSRLAWEHLRPDPDYQSSQLYKLHKRYVSIVPEIVSEGVASGEFSSSTDARFVRALVYGSIEHLVWGYLHRGEKFDAESMTNALAKTILQGILHRVDCDDYPCTTESQLTRLESAVEKLEHMVASGT